MFINALSSVLFNGRKKNRERSNIYRRFGRNSVAHYERLRQEAVQGQIRNGPGLSVLISRGMLALMNLVDQIPKSNHPKEPFRQERVQSPLLQETETQTQIVQLLAAMVLGRHQEVIHVC
jgi:hypothetical protein